MIVFVHRLLCGPETEITLLRRDPVDLTDLTSLSSTARTQMLLLALDNTILPLTRLDRNFGHCSHAFDRDA